MPLVRLDNEVNNMTAIRLNCLLLAVQDEKPSRKVDLAKEYYTRVVDGKIPNDNIAVSS